MPLFRAVIRNPSTLSRISPFICFKTQMLIKSNCLWILLVDGNFPDSIILNTIFLPKYSKEAPPRASSLLLHIFSYYFLSVPFPFQNTSRYNPINTSPIPTVVSVCACKDSSIHDSQFVSVRITEIVFAAI